MEETISEINPALTALLSAFIPMVLALINRYNWTTEAKSLVSFILTCAIGFCIAWFQGVKDFDGIVTVIAAVYALSQVAYFGIWKPTGTAKTVEKKTG